MKEKKVEVSQIAELLGKMDEMGYFSDMKEVILFRVY